MSPDDERLTELVLYVAQRTADASVPGPTLGEYVHHADTAALRWLGRPLTGAARVTPARLSIVRVELVRSGEARMEPPVAAAGAPCQRLVAERSPRTDVFTADELALVDAVITALLDLPGGEPEAAEPAGERAADRQVAAG